MGLRSSSSAKTMPVSLVSRSNVSSLSMCFLLKPIALRASLRVKGFPLELVFGQADLPFGGSDSSSRAAALPASCSSSQCPSLGHWVSAMRLGKSLLS
jgi:hypothetical protein